MSDVFSDSLFTPLEENTNKHGIKNTKGIAYVLNSRAKIQEVSVLSTSLQTAVDTVERAFTLFPEQSSKSKDSLDYILKDFSTKPALHRVLFNNRCSTLFM